MRFNFFKSFFIFISLAQMIDRVENFTNVCVNKNEKQKFGNIFNGKYLMIQLS